jgi:cobalt transporter subunit CbtB
MRDFMSNHAVTEANDTSASTSLGGRALAATIAALLGAFILLGIGFLHSTTLHNAAHDSRHSFSFPCH